MFEDAISMLSIFASMHTWLTPTVLFLVLNLMIGTIAFTSSFSSHKPNNHHINHHHHHYHHPQPPLQPPTLTRAPSVLQRLKSTMSFSSFYSHHYHHQPSTTTTTTTTTSNTTTYFQPRQPDPEPEPKPESEPEPTITTEEEEEGPTLDEVYSRIKQANINPHYGRQNSDTKPSNGEIPVKLPQKMKKSASDKSAFNHFELHSNNNNVNVGPGASIMEDDDDVDDREEVEEGGVDAKADDFINKFKKQLELQRKESIVRYNQMIHSRTPHDQ